MSIQQDINQSIGLASALLSINPTVQDAAKKRSELKSVDKQLSSNLEMQKTVVKEDGLSGDLQNNLEADERQLLERKFRLDPTTENYRKLRRATPTVMKDDPDTIQQERLENAETDARNQAEYDYTYTTAYNKAYADFANQRAARARDTKSELKNDYYIGGQRINDALGQSSIDYLSGRESKDEQK